MGHTVEENSGVLATTSLECGNSLAVRNVGTYSEEKTVASS